jgi:hypothetical protein
VISRRRPARLALTLFAVAVAFSPMQRTEAAQARDLTGWWISIDQLFPMLYESGGTVAMEELLVIAGDGRAENRFLTFMHADPERCRDTKEQCSDAPVVASARITVTGDQLAFTDVVIPDNKLDHRFEVNLSLRLLAVTGTRSWTLSLAADGRLLTLRQNVLNVSRLVTKIPERTFAKIEPDTLRRARALLLARELPAANHWRCLIANVMAHDAAFAPLERQPRAAPTFLDGAMKAASYMDSLGEAVRRPVSDDTDPEQRKLASVKVEMLLTEEFQDIPQPANVAERSALQARWRTLVLHLRGNTTAVGPGMPLAEAELADLAKAMGEGPEAKKLFCRN